MKWNEVTGVPNALVHDATISKCLTSWIAQALFTFRTFRLLLPLHQHAWNKCNLAALFLIIKQLDATEFKEIFCISFFFLLLWNLDWFRWSHLFLLISQMTNAMNVTSAVMQLISPYHMAHNRNYSHVNLFLALSEIKLVSICEVSV